jgi:hypothetical protein
MAFKVGFQEPGSIPSEYDDDCSYMIRNNGLLVLHKGGKRWHISPTAWSWVEDAAPEAPDEIDVQFL